MHITICGLAGTGTSTAGKLLAQELGYEFLSSGGLFRQMAADLGLELNEFEALCQQNDHYDRKLDRQIAEIGRSRRNTVIESRLAWHFIPHSLKVKINCQEVIRITRVAERDDLSFDQAKAKTVHREELIRERYRQYYGIEDFDADANFDLVLDSTHTPPAKLVAGIKAKINS